MRGSVAIGPMALVLLVARTSGAIAQTDTSDTPSVPAGVIRAPVCWVPGPEVRCRSYVVTEVTAELPSRSPDRRLGARFGYTLGAMINRGPSDAVGLLASVMQGPAPSGPTRVEGRYRRWLGGRTGLDLTLGYAQHNVGEFRGPDVWLRGVTAAAAIEHRMLGIESRVDRVRGGGRMETSASVGARVGGPAAPLTALAAYIGLILWLTSDYHQLPG